MRRLGEIVPKNRIDCWHALLSPEASEFEGIHSFCSWLAAEYRDLLIPHFQHPDWDWGACAWQAYLSKTPRAVLECMDRSSLPTWQGMLHDRALYAPAAVKPYRQRCSDYLVVPGSEKWEELSPWQATYWKALPRGNRVRFLIARNPDWPERFVHDDEARERIRKRGEDDARNEWFFDRIRKWYNEYEESPVG